MSQIPKFIGNNRFKMKKNFQTFLIRVKKTQDYSFFCLFISCIKTNSSRINYGFIRTASRHTHFTGKRWSFILHFLNIAQTILILENKQKEREQDPNIYVIRWIYHFSSFFPFSVFLKQSLDGFALALAADGRFLYISETVSIYLGLSQVSKTIHLRWHVYIYVFWGRFEEATKNLFMCSLHILHTDGRIGQAHLEKLIQLQKHHNFH